MLLQADLSEIEVEVLGYLDEHPQAADTAEGVRHWWLLRRLSRYSGERVQAALNELIEKKLIGVQRVANGRTVYGRLPPSLN